MATIGSKVAILAGSERLQSGKSRNYATATTITPQLTPATVQCRGFITAALTAPGLGTDLATTANRNPKV
jgi:hypothetical protein